MNRQNIATTIVLLLSSIAFAVVGTSYMQNVYEKTKIVVSDPIVVAGSSIKVYDDIDQDKNQLEYIEFSDSELGLKPVTGSIDADTKIPSTVTNKNGSEGLYANIKVSCNSAGLKIVVKNILIESKQEDSKIQKQRENIFLGIMDKQDGAKSLKENEVVLIEELEPVVDKLYTILFWLDSKASEDLIGAKISFELHFIV